MRSERVSLVEERAPIRVERADPVYVEERAPIRVERAAEPIYVEEHYVDEAPSYRTTGSRVVSNYY